MSSSYLILISNIYCYLSSAQQVDTTCVNRQNHGQYSICKWKFDHYELDLTPFQLMGLNLTGSDGNGNNYYFTPCNNLLPSPDYYSRWQYMAIQVNKGEERRFLAQYNATVDPTIKFDKNAQPIWRFQYNENFSVEYYCDYTLLSESFMEIMGVTQVSNDSYLMRVSSYYVCNNVTASNQLNKNQCMWYDETKKHLLDLRSLSGQHITAGGSFSAYRLDICQNSRYDTTTKDSQKGSCTTSGCCAMYTYYDPSASAKDDDSSAYGIFNPSTQPLFDSEWVHWTFEYKSYPNSSPLIIRWMCDPDAKPYSVVRADAGQMVIASTYACPQRHECIFDDGENILDLSELYGAMIKYINEDNLTYSFEYTVCSNNIICNGSIETMAMRWNVYETQCDPYLAMWDGFDGYDLSYNEGLKQWKITYDNGEICENERNTEFNIYWICNQTVPKWEVMSVETMNECEYAMYIGSSFAC